MDTKREPSGVPGTARKPPNASDDTARKPSNASDGTARKPPNASDGTARKPQSALDTLALPLLVIGVLLAVVAFVLSFTTAPLALGAAVDLPALIGDRMVANKLLLSQKIFYFHMPVAVVSMVALLFTAIYGALFLARRDSRFDLRAKVATEIALVFVLMTMASGELWERFEWGVWWTWEPRLTTYFILMLLVIGYFILRNAIDDTERRATFASVFGIIAFIDVPICLLITRLIPTSTHPVIFRTDSGLPPPMLLPLLLAMAGMCCIAFGLFRLRLHEQQLRGRLEALKEALEDVEGGWPPPAVPVPSARTPSVPPQKTQED